MRISGRFVIWKSVIIIQDWLFFQKVTALVMNFLLTDFFNGTLVQLVRAPPCHGGSRGFEFHTYRIAYKTTFWETLGGREDDCVIFVFVLA